MHALGIVEKVDVKSGTGVVALSRGERSLFYLHQGRQVEIKGKELAFIGPRLVELPSVGDEIICNRPGYSMVDHWIFYRDYAKAQFENWAATLQPTHLHQYRQETYIEDVVLPRVRIGHPKKCFPRIIRRKDMDEIFKKLRFRLPLAMEIEPSIDWRDRVIGRVVSECLENKPNGLTGW